MKTLLIPFINYKIDKLKYLESSHINSFSELRKRKVCCIDDRRFDELERLALRGIKVDHFMDITNIDTIIRYDIIMCDINGVGLYLDSKGSGVDIIRAIIREFPAKYIIAYSSILRKSTGKEKLVDDARNFSDDYIVKSPSLPIESWVSTLNKAASSISNPYKNWLRVRKRLEKDADIVPHIPMLENFYVRFVLSKNIKYKQTGLATLKSLSIAADIDELFGDSISSIFEFI